MAIERRSEHSVIARCDTAGCKSVRPLKSDKALDDREISLQLRERGWIEDCFLWRCPKHNRDNYPCASKGELLTVGAVIDVEHAVASGKALEVVNIQPTVIKDAYDIYLADGQVFCWTSMDATDIKLVADPLAPGKRGK